MEQHEQDGRTPEDPWQQAGDRWSAIGVRMKDRYRELVGDDGPSEDDVRAALRTLGTAMQTLADSVGDAMRDPEMKTQVKDAAAGLAGVVGQTFSDLGEELRKHSAPDQPGSP